MSGTTDPISVAGSGDVHAGDVCPVCLTFTTPWRCCCDWLTTTVDPAEDGLSTYVDVIEVGVRNVEQAFARGARIPGAVA